MSNKNEKAYSSQNAKDVFARQKARFALSEEEQALAEKMGLADKDLSSFDFYAEEDESENEYEADGLAIDGYTLEDAVYADTDSLETYDEKLNLKPVVDEALDFLIDAINNEQYSKYTMDMSEKLLLIACGADLVQAVICCAKHLAEHEMDHENLDSTNRRGTTGEQLNYEHRLMQILKRCTSMGVDTQTTLAYEMHLIENEYTMVDNLFVQTGAIADRLEEANKERMYWDGINYDPEVLNTVFEIVIEHYKYVSNAFYYIYEDMLNFVSKYLNVDIVLNDSGRYDRELSVICRAKYEAFGDEFYPLPGDENRVYVHEKEQPKDKPLPKSKIDTDVQESYSTFLELKKYEASSRKRASMIASCVELLKSFTTDDDNVVCYCEKLMMMDDKRQYADTIAKHRLTYDLFNGKSSFAVHLGKKVKSYGYAKDRVKEEQEKERKPLFQSIPGEELVLAAVFLVLTLALTLTPLGIFEKIFETVMKVIYVIVIIVCLLTTGVAAIFTAPICIAIINFCLGIFEIFPNPLLAVKITFMLLFALAAYLFGQSTISWLKEPAEKRKIIEQKNEDMAKIKAEVQPWLEEILAYVKETDMPVEIVKYYERMKAKFTDQ